MANSTSRQRVLKISSRTYSARWKRTRLSSEWKHKGHMKCLKIILFLLHVCNSNSPLPFSYVLCFYWNFFSLFDSEKQKRSLTFRYISLKWKYESHISPRQSCVEWMQSEMKTFWLSHRNELFDEIYSNKYRNSAEEFSSEKLKSFGSRMDSLRRLFGVFKWKNVICCESNPSEWENELERFEILVSIFGEIKLWDWRKIANGVISVPFDYCN